MVRTAPFRSSVLLLLVVCGCGNEPPVVGLKPDEPAPAKHLDGPGFSLDVPQDWSSAVESTKLVLTAPGRKSSAKIVVEVTPYQTDETSDTILQKAKDDRQNLRNAKHHFGTVDGLQFYRCVFATRAKRNDADSAFVLMPLPGKKVVATVECDSMSDLLASTVSLERSLNSIRVP